MQSRFWLSTHDEFDKAATAKHTLKEKNPDNNYQIRKGRESSKIVFRLVERFDRKEANVINERNNPTGWKRRPSKKQRREREIASIL